ncbi:MAG: hypothetical protein NTX26_00270 [Candidatus Parcubacteria bacterium]|nr:hypothetical protein [Candidatus Parcubacteria bacterium]
MRALYYSKFLVYMKKKILIIIVSIILISLGAIVAYNFFNNKIVSSMPLSRQGKIETNYFKLVLPSGWETQEPASENFVLIAYRKEDSKDSLARKINYKTSLFIAREELNGKTIVDYVAFLKESVQQKKENVLFHSENETSFNGQKAYLIDVELKENDIEFKSIFGVIEGKNQEVWVISFNTPKLDWITTAPQFYSILNSFSIN